MSPRPFGLSEELQRLVCKLFDMEMKRRNQACRSSGLGRRVLEASRRKLEVIKKNPVLNINGRGFIQARIYNMDPYLERISTMDHQSAHAYIMRVGSRI